MHYIVTILACSLLPFSFFATPIENPFPAQLIDEGLAFPSAIPFSLRAGYEGDFVFDARMKQSSGSGLVDCYRQTTNSAIVTLNFLDRLDLFSILGSSQTKFQWRISLPLDVIRRLELETNYDFLWGIGFRTLLWDDEHLYIALGGRYETSQYGLDWLFNSGESVPTQGSSLLWRSWQANLQLAYTIDFLTPYVGVAYLNNISWLENANTQVSNQGGQQAVFRNKIPVGISIGCSIANRKYFVLNVEGRLVNEEALTFSGEFRF